MKILVLSNMAPFVWGGAEELCTHLVRNLKMQGMTAEAFRIPFSWNPAERIWDEMVIARSLRLWDVDRVIALKFPAYLVPWDNKVIWLLHQFRQCYDLFDSGHSHVPRTADGDALRAAVGSADNHAFAGAKALFANAPVTADRLRRYNGFEAEVLAPPLNDPELFAGGLAEGYVLAAGRVSAGKRQELLVRALRHAPGVRLVVAGPPDTLADAEALRQTVVAAGVEDRVQLDIRLLARAELAALVNGASAVAYLPIDEDSVGYVTMEAFQAAKPVITTSDAGGVLQLVRDGDTGWVADPSPEGLGGALRAALTEAGRTAKRGAAGRARLTSMHLDWPTTIERLLA